MDYLSRSSDSSIYLQQGNSRNGLGIHAGPYIMRFRVEQGSEKLLPLFRPSCNRRAFGTKPKAPLDLGTFLNS